MTDGDNDILLYMGLIIPVTVLVAIILVIVVLIIRWCC